MTRTPDHSCTMFCSCPVAQGLAGGTAAASLGPPRRHGAPSSPREAAQRVALERPTRWRDPR